MAGSNPKKILLVEDEVLIAVMLKQQLEAKGYQVSYVTTGEKAVDLLSKQDDLPDLVLMDISLGSGIDGVETASRILNNRDIPIIFLSSHTDPSIVEKTEKVNSYGYVVKNSGEAVLEAAITTALRLFEEKKRAKREFYLSGEGKYHRLFKSLGDGFVFVDMKGNIRECNETYRQMLGYSEEELMQLSYQDLTPESWGEFEQNLVENQILPYGYSEVYVKEYMKKDGTVFPVELRTFLLRDNEGNPAGMWAIVRDITERKKEEDLLRTRENFYKEISGVMSDYLFLLRIEPDGKMVREFSLGEISRFIGFQSAGADIADEWTKLIIPEDKELFDDCMRNVYQGVTSNFEIRIRTRNNELKYLNEYHVPIWDEKENRVTHVFGAFQDITERKMADEEIKRMLNEKTILLQEAHHRIKNNISSIENLLSLQRNLIRNPEGVTVFNDAINRVKTIRLLHEKLSYVENFSGISIKTYFEDLVDSVIAISPEARKIKVEKNISDFQIDTKSLVPLGLIVNELLSNALKHAFAGRTEGKLNISILKAGTRVTVSIEDDGIGNQADSRIEEKKGLGLMLVNMLAEQVAGNFSVIQGNGTKCIFEFEIAH
jgi:PAS domain S-box-containing protein